MTPLSRGTVRCTRCRATGLLDDRAVCPLCEGAGAYQRLVVPIKIVAAADIWPAKDASFQRLAVMLAKHTDDEGRHGSWDGAFCLDGGRAVRGDRALRVRGARFSVGAMKSRNRVGREASRRVQRWPSHNHFAELQPDQETAHPVDRLLDATPEIARASRRARRLLERLQRRLGDNAVLEFEAERNAAEWARVEGAYNLGFEGGLVLGRAAGVRYAVHGGRRGKDELTLLQSLRAALSASALPSRRVQMVLLELAYAHAAGPAEDEEIAPSRDA